MCPDAHQKSVLEASVGFKNKKIIVYIDACESNAPIFRIVGYRDQVESADRYRSRAKYFESERKSFILLKIRCIKVIEHVEFYFDSFEYRQDRGVQD